MILSQDYRVFLWSTDEQPSRDSRKSSTSSIFLLETTDKRLQVKNVHYTKLLAVTSAISHTTSYTHRRFFLWTGPNIDIFSRILLCIFKELKRRAAGAVGGVPLPLGVLLQQDKMAPSHTPRQWFTKMPHTPLFASPSSKKSFAH